MPDKKCDNNMVDFPCYDPDARVPFPPTEGATPFGKAAERTPTKAKPPQKPYHETYNPDSASPSPAQTTPGAPDLKDIHARPLTEAELKAFSPDVDLKE